MEPFFLATGNDGMRAYSYDGSSLINTAHIDLSDFSIDVTVASDGTIFLAYGDKGLFAYTYSVYVGIEDNFEFIMGNYTLSQNYPNPFNPKTIINYELRITNYVDLSIYNLLGQKVATLVNKKQTTGNCKVEWDASGFTSGIYFYRIEAGEFQDVKKMILLK